MIQNLESKLNKAYGVNAAKAAAYLETLVTHANMETLQILAEKAVKPGMNDKLKKYKGFI